MPKSHATSDAHTVANDIRAALSGDGACTSTTVTALESLLCADRNQAGDKENEVPVRSKKSATVTSTRIKQTGSTRTKTKTTLRVEIEETKADFSARDRFALATDVVNTSLKTLASSLKAASKPANSKEGSLAPPATERTHARSKSSPVNNAMPKSAATGRASKPLQSRAVSQLSNASQARPSVERSPSHLPDNQKETAAQTNAVAECCRLAFAYLRSAEVQKSFAKELPFLQVEQGMLSLVGKLIGLGMVTSALKELHVLQRRLRRHVGDERRADGIPETTKEKASLASLIDIQVRDRSSAAMPTVITYHQYVLKTFSQLQRASVVEAILPFLSPAYEHSLGRLILVSANTDEQKQRAARQLESLSQQVLALAPSISVSFDEAAADATKTTSPETSLSVQRIAFQLRLTWWELSGHQGDFAKEILDPFGRCMTTYSRRSKTSGPRLYEHALQEFRTLQGAAGAVPDIVKKACNINNTIPTLMKQSLGILAQAAGLLDEAMEWTGDSADHDQTGSSSVPSAARIVKLGVLLFEKSSKDGFDQAMQSKMEASINALGEPLQGSATDMASLLTEVTALRRAAIKVFLGKSGPERPDKAHLSICFRALASCIQFLARYIGSTPSEESEAVILQRFTDRIAAVINVAKPFFECAIVASKHVIAHGHAAWKELDNCLQWCMRLFLFVSYGCDKEEINTLHQQLGAPLLKVSNSYWSYYTKLKTTSDVTLDDKCQAIERSADALCSCPSSDKAAGSQVAKLEKLVEIRRERKQYREAMRHCHSALSALIEFGVLDRASALAATLPLGRVWTSHSDNVSFRRLLNLSQRSAFRADVEDYIFDDLELGAEKRAALLECQLDLLSQDGYRHNDKSLSSARVVASRLLSLYAPTDFPIRRQRALGLLFTISSDPTTDLAGAWTDDELSENFDLPKNLRQDVKLKSMGTYFCTLAELRCFLHDGSGKEKRLEAIISSWVHICSNSEDAASLEEQVDSPDRWLHALRSLSTWLNIRGEDSSRVRILQLLARVCGILPNASPSQVLSILTDLGLAHLKLGHTGKCGVTLVKAKTLLDRSEVEAERKLSWHLAYAQYLLAIGDTDKSATTLKEAQSLAGIEKVDALLTTPGTNFVTKVQVRRILADARFVYSRLAMQCGAAEDALRHAKACVLLNRRVWVALENRGNACVKDDSGDNLHASGSSSNPAFADMPIAGNVGGVVSVTHGALSRPHLWPAVPSIFESLTNLAELNAHQGMYEEAMYHHEQAHRVAVAVKAEPLLLMNLSSRATLALRAGDIEKGQLLLDQSKEFLVEVDRHIATVSYYEAAALACRAIGDFDDEALMHDRAEEVVNVLIADVSPEEQIAEDAKLTNSMSQLSLDSNLKPPRPTKAASTKAARGRKPGARSAPKSSSKGEAIQPSAESIKRSDQEIHILDALRSEIRREKSVCCMLQGKPLDAAKLLMDEHTSNLPQLVSSQITTARQIFVQFIEDLSSDLMLNGLPESTISFPATRSAGRKLSAASDGHGGVVVLPRSPIKQATKATKAAKSKMGLSQNHVAALVKARDCLASVYRLTLQLGSNMDISQMCLLSSQISVLLSAVGCQDPQALPHPLRSASYLELPRNQALGLEKRAIAVEVEATRMSLYKSWPTATAASVQSPSLSQEFQADFIDLIPDAWSVVSMSISETRDELYITRYRSRESPFILRLPMGRHQSRDLDEETFSFDDGKVELMQIIELSDYSAQDSRNMSVKGAKADWWAEREALDGRLKELLVNIENIWLGGFRGIFSPRAAQLDLMSRFRKSFDDILISHLPSRRGRGATRKIDLDARIFELFIGLGDPSSEDIDLDEPMMDLIYFILDIFQFNGERNALDEVDIDAIVVETIDAVGAYHRAIQDDINTHRHTILILDKDLHCFPWESLPSLQTTAISRLPSIASFKERLRAAQSSYHTASAQEPDAPFGHYIQPGGTTVLNPSGDLPRTEKLLQPYLHSLRGKWTHMHSRPPSESKFEHALTSSSTLLYFGHGGGSQYIRQKAIKKLCLPELPAAPPLNSTNTEQAAPDSDKQQINSQNVQAAQQSTPRCATTWLMGCSSASLSLHGAYEPSGTVLSYMTAGAPAVLGMLWDVTDRDVDRFAVRCGDLWGLWEEQDDAAKEGRRAKGKGKVGKRKAERRGDGVRKRSLSEAVWGSRDACYLRYLNGAAGVVYGIPVYLGG